MNGEVVAVLRQCRRCQVWLNIGQFSPLARLCKPCMRTKRVPSPVNTIARARSFVLTEKGRAAIREAAA